MINPLLPLVFSFALLLSACGGDAGTAAPPDTAAPVLNSLTSAKSAISEFTMTATGTDNVGLVGYCFKITSTAPLASDACFQASNQKKITLSVPLPPVYVWGKDAAGNVSANALVGPCSSAGYLASGTSNLPTVCMMTSLGELVLALENVKAPATATNFLLYVNDGFYSDTVFDRIRSTFVVQGGGFTYQAATSQYTPKSPTRAPITLEAPAITGLSNTLGTIAMARTTELNSATTQFFINVVDNTGLDANGGGYAVFGRMISGMATLDAIKAVAVVSNGVANGNEVSQPITPPVIQWAIQLK
jgi:peptidyl-prolyl cis-trans isomerase A (cyclophilin A)